MIYFSHTTVQLSSPATEILGLSPREEIQFFASTLAHYAALPAGPERPQAPG